MLKNIFNIVAVAAMCLASSAAFAGYVEWNDSDDDPPPYWSQAICAYVYVPVLCDPTEG